MNFISMLSPYTFDSRLEVYTLTRTYDGVGNVDTWTLSATLWCSVVHEFKNKWTDVFVEYGQRFAKNIIYKLIVREKQRFTCAEHKFVWKAPHGDRILRPINSQIIPGHRRHQYTSIIVEDVTEMSDPT